MPMSYDEYVLAEFTKHQDRFLGSATELGMFLGKGVLLANGAGLLACYTALTNNPNCRIEAFEALVWMFAAGFVLGLAGLTTSYFVSIRLVKLLGRMVVHAIVVANPSSADDDKKAARAALGELHRDHSGIGTFWERMVLFLQIAGGLVFLVTAIAPVINPAMAASLCASPS